ncbi:MAG: HAD family hydrolase [Acidobacteriota bacterium]
MCKEARIKCVIFDMDGTIVDVPYDWTQIKKELETGGKPILNYLEELEEPKKSEKWNILKTYEKNATQRAILKKGIVHFLRFVKRNDILSALVTNNSKENVFYLLDKFNLNFDLVMTRESGLWKPSAEPFFQVMDQLSLDEDECCVIGDSHFDIMAAKEAGIEKVFIINKNIRKFKREDAEVYGSFKEIKNRLVQII